MPNSPYKRREAQRLQIVSTGFIVYTCSVPDVVKIGEFSVAWEGRYVPVSVEAE